jgi:iron complex transport system ATP-binding protein
MMLKEGKVFAFGEVEKVLTAENIRSVFDVEAIVRKNVATNSLYVIPLSPKKEAAAKKCTVHVICGAGTGSVLLKTLVDDGFCVSAGVLNVLDTDYETCEILNIPVVSEAPFSNITDKAYRANLELMQSAGMVVVTSVPFGSGNLRNLDAAKEALKLGVPVYVIEHIPIERRDFTEGKATAKMDELRSLGAVFVKNHSDLLGLLNLPRLSPSEFAKMTLKGHMKTLQDDPTGEAKV